MLNIQMKNVDDKIKNEYDYYWSDRLGGLLPAINFRINNYQSEEYFIFLKENEKQLLLLQKQFLPILSQYIKSCASNLERLATGKNISSPELRVMVNKNGKIDTQLLENHIKNNADVIQDYADVATFFINIFLAIDTGTSDSLKIIPMSDTTTFISNVKKIWSDLKSKELETIRKFGFTDELFTKLDKYDSSPDLNDEPEKK